MALNLWFPEDVERILVSLANAVLEHPDREYQRVYFQALKHVALAFGIGMDKREEGARLAAGEVPIR